MEVKLFVGNVAEETSVVELRELFVGAAAEAGEVLSVKLLRWFAFVHMRDEEAAQRAILRLNDRTLHGLRLHVTLSVPKRRPPRLVRIFVANVSRACTDSDIRSLFQEHGHVFSCALLKDIAFVHMEEKEAITAIEQVKGRKIKGKKLKVKISIKDQKPGLAGQVGKIQKEPEQEQEQKTTEKKKKKRKRKMRLPTLDELKARSERLRSTLEDDYQQHISDNNTTKCDSQETQARQISPSYSGRDGSPLRRSPTRTGNMLPMATQQAPYRDHPGAALSASYGAQPATSQSALYSTHPPSAQPASYGVQPPVSHITSDGAQAASAVPAAYGTQSTDNLAAVATAPASYKTQLTISMSSAYSPAEATYAAQHSASISLAAAAVYQAQSAYNGLAQAYSAMDQPDASSIPPPYERTRLSPPRTSREDHYRKAAALSKRSPASNPTEATYAAQHSASISLAAAAVYRARSAYNGMAQAYSTMDQPDASNIPPPYERIRLSPPRTSREELYR